MQRYIKIDRPLDSHGQRVDRIAVKVIMKRDGAEARIAAAQERRARRKVKRIVDQQQAKA